MPEVSCGENPESLMDASAAYYSARDHGKAARRETPARRECVENGGEEKGVAKVRFRGVLRAFFAKWPVIVLKKGLEIVRVGADNLTS
jgi:hypothetical protein